MTSEEQGAPPRRFYRSIKAPQVKEFDFLSHAQRGKVAPRQDPDFLRRWRGLSVFTTYEAARENAFNLRWRIGEYIAEVEIPEGIDFECDGPDERGHCNLYGLAASDLLLWVKSVSRGAPYPPGC